MNINMCYEQLIIVSCCQGPRLESSEAVLLRVLRGGRPRRPVLTQCSFLTQLKVQRE